MKIHFFLLFILISAYLSGQNKQLDSLKQALAKPTTLEEKVQIYHKMFDASRQNYQDSALVYAHKALDLSRESEDKLLHNRSYFNLSNAYKLTFQPDSLKKTLLSHLLFLKSNDLDEELAKVYRNLAVHGEVTREPDSSLYYIDKCLEALAMFPDSSTMGSAYLSQGFAYRVKGFYNQAIASFHKALEVLESHGSANQMGYTYQNIGIAYALNEREEKAIEMSEKACEKFELAGNERALAQTKNNIGYMAYSLEKYDRALEALTEAKMYAHKTDQDWVSNNIHWNMARVYYFKNQFDSTLMHLDSVEKYTTIIQDDFMPGGILRWKAKVALAQNDIYRANELINAALPYDHNYNDPSLHLEIKEDMAELYEGVGEIELALQYWKSADVLQDSLFNLAKDRQIEELSVQYETAKKDAEIIQLNADQVIVKSKNRLLIIGLISILIAGISIIYALYQRRKRERLVHEKEKELAAERENALLNSLEQKKKELTATVLQVAKKNEFLNHLGEQVGALHSTLDGQINRTSKKISRMIKQSSNDKDDWEHFKKEFTSIHSRFLEELREKHGEEFTKNEMRLIALMKMNLSSKEIANLLQVSQDGIKKARYRLRKKMSLDGNIDIQSYLINLA